MLGLQVIEFSSHEWEREGFYIPELNLYGFRDDVSAERRQELIKHIL